MSNKERLGGLLNLRVEPDTLERSDALAERLPFGRPAIIRAALRIGLSALEADASLLLLPEAMPRKGKAKRRAPK